MNNTSKHVVLFSSPLFTLVVLFLLLFYRISSVCLALHACAPRASLARALRAPQGVIQVGPKLAPKMFSRASCAILALLDASKASEMPQRSARNVPKRPPERRQDCPRRVQDVPKTPPDELQHRKKHYFSLIFSMFLCSEGFGADPGRSWPKELSKTHPRRPEKLPRRPQDRARRPQETFR